MDLSRALQGLVAVALVAALAPIIVAILPGRRVPQVIIFIAGGVLIGPHGLGLSRSSDLQLLSDIGLGFLFLLAGYELDPALFRRQPGQVTSGEADLPGVVRAQPGDDLQQRGLAGPGRAEHDEHPAGRDGQVDRPEPERSGTDAQPADS